MSTPLFLREVAIRGRGPLRCLSQAFGPEYRAQKNPSPEYRGEAIPKTDFKAFFNRALGTYEWRWRTTSIRKDCFDYSITTIFLVALKSPDCN